MLTDKQPVIVVASSAHLQHKIALTAIRLVCIVHWMMHRFARASEPIVTATAGQRMKNRALAPVLSPCSTMVSA